MCGMRDRQPLDSNHQLTNEEVFRLIYAFPFMFAGFIATTYRFINSEIALGITDFLILTLLAHQVTAEDQESVYPSLVGAGLFLIRDGILRITDMVPDGVDLNLVVVAICLLKAAQSFSLLNGKDKG